MESLRPGRGEKSGLRALSKGAGKGGKMAWEHLAKERSFSLAFQTQRFCLATVLVICLLLGSLCPEETRAPLLTHEVGTAGSSGGALVRAQELILITGEALSRGEESRGVGPKPSIGEGHHVQGVVPSGCNLELGLVLCWNLLIYSSSELPL